MSALPTPPPLPIQSPAPRRGAARRPASVGFVFLVLIAWITGLVVVSILLVFVAAALSGVNIMQESTTQLQIAQVMAWLCLLTAVFVGAAWLTMRRHKSARARLSRQIMAWIGGVLIAVYAITSAGSYVTGVTSAQACDMTATLSQAMSATYPLRTDKASGTAFAINGSGTLVTAYHVIEDAKTVTVDWRTGEVPVKVIRVDKARDLAVLHYAGETPDFVPLTTRYQPTDTVFALGWPANTFDVGQPSISKGIVSRTIDGYDARLIDDAIPADMSFIQTDAAINPGNSGGPLINACGVIGVVDAISTSEADFGLPREEGIGYAISTSTLQSLLNE
jgi:S1-C subfamily serine protease